MHVLYHEEQVIPEEFIVMNHNPIFFADLKKMK